MTKFNLKSKCRVYVPVLLTMLILSLIFINSFYWTYEGVSTRKILVWGIVFFAVIVFPIVITSVRFFYQGAEKTLCKIQKSIKATKQNKKQIFRVFGFLVLGAGAAYGITYAVSKYVLKTAYHERLFYFLLVVSILFVFFISVWKHATQEVEKIFVVVALCLGIFCIAVSPSRVGVSWDDEIHYFRTLEVSNFLNGYMYEADEQNIADYGTNIAERNGYDRETAKVYNEKLHTSYEAKEGTEYVFSYPNLASIPYLPGAAGIILARGLGLSYEGVFNMGRAFQLLAYVGIIFWAMKKVKYGKVLIAAIGLIPTSLFMASHYSYDWWVISLTILGFAYFIAELQDERPLQYKNVLIMVGAIVLGCLPKAVYFPLLFPLLFMPKRKFRDSKQRMLYYLTVIIGGLLLVAYFVLPVLMSGAGTGDVRGGSEVNSTEQIKFILNNPGLYAKILMMFELDYLSLANTNLMLYRFAYMGNGYLYGITGCMLLILAFLDRGGNERKYYGIKCATLVGNAAALILSTTALYVGFTAVGLHTVSGMQGRYLLPFIYPALFALGVGGTTHKINRNTFVCVPMIISAIMFICNIGRICVLYY